MKATDAILKRFRINGRIGVTVTFLAVLAILNSNTVAQEHPAGAVLAITVDGENPAAAPYNIPVGSCQDFAALWIDAGGTKHLAAPSEIEWSLQADNRASLQITEKGFASVDVRNDGTGRLYARSGEGISAELALSFEPLAHQSNGPSFLALTVPKDGGRILYQQAASGIPLTSLALYDGPVPLKGVQFYLDGTLIDTAATAPYAVTYRDVSALPSWARHRVTANALFEHMGDSILEKEITFSVVPVDADKNSDGLPDDPFATGLLPGDIWLGCLRNVPGTNEALATPAITVVAALASGSAPNPPVVIQDPDNPARTTVITPPIGLLFPEETGFLVAFVCNDLNALADKLPSSLPGEMVAQGRFVFVSVLASRDRGKTVYTLDAERLAATPIRVDMHGVGVVPVENARFLFYPGEATDSDTSECALALTSDESWEAPARGSRTETGLLSTWVTQSGLYAPFRTQDQIKIMALWNVKTGVPSGYSVGGDTVVIRIAGVPTGKTPSVAFQDVPAPQVQRVNRDEELYEVIVPRAPRTSRPTISLAVDVRAWLPDQPYNADTLPHGFTYTGPTVSTVKPDVGSPDGGTTVWVWGEGFDTEGMAGRMGVSSLVQIADITPLMFRAVTTRGNAGTVDLTVRTANGYLGTLRNAFTYSNTAQTESGISLLTPSVVTASRTAHSRASCILIRPWSGRTVAPSSASRARALSAAILHPLGSSSTAAKRRLPRMSRGCNPPTPNCMWLCLHCPKKRLRMPTGFPWTCKWSIPTVPLPVMPIA